MKTLMKSGWACAGIAVLLTSAGCSRSRDEKAAADRGMANPSGYADRATTLSAADREFASKAAQGGMAEVQMGNLAQQQGSTDGVKDYGRKLVQDHTRMNNDLKEIAARENITLP